MTSNSFFTTSWDPRDDLYTIYDHFRQTQNFDLKKKQFCYLSVDLFHLFRQLQYFFNRFLNRCVMVYSSIFTLIDVIIIIKIKKSFFSEDCSSEENISRVKTTFPFEEWIFIFIRMVFVFFCFLIVQCAKKKIQMMLAGKVFTK